MGVHLHDGAVDRDGRPGATALEQAEIIWSNIGAILDSAGMTLSDIVKVTTYSISAEHLPALKEVRDRVLAGHLPASLNGKGGRGTAE